MEYKQITLTEIYIPICFYFNEDQNKEVSKLLLFTFHYVSILIYASCRIIFGWFGFTFQYVSILIQKLSAESLM